MTITHSRVTQYIGILLALGLIAVGYWYFSARAGVNQGAPLGGPAPSNLIGYFPFDGDDISGTTAYDRSGQGGDAYLANGPTKVTGKLGQALSFDGTDDFVNRYNSFNFTSSDFTISHWVKLNSLTTNQGGQGPVLIYKGSYQINGYYSQVDTSGGLFFATNQSGAAQSSSVPANTIVPGNWYHITYVRQGASVRIYINGIDSTSVAGTHVNPTSSSSDFRVGHYFGSSINMNGVMDELRIYNTALTAAQIYDLYKLGGETVGASTPTRDSLNEGLAGYWKLDDASGTTATDSSTNGNNGTLTNGPTWGTGRIGSDVIFDGSNDYINVPDSDSLSITGDMTISAWVNASDFSGYKHIASKSNGNQPGPYDFYLYPSNGRPQLLRGNGIGNEAVQANTAPALGQWQHVLVTMAGTTVTHYLNGALNGGGTLSTTIADSGTTLKIGSRDDLSNFMTGGLDEVRIYNRPLSAEEVTKLYKTTTPSNPDTRLKGYWSFDGDSISGTTALDLSGAGNHGTLTNSPAKDIGIRGQAMNFDGTDDTVLVQNSSSLNITQAITVSAWVYGRSWANTEQNFIVAKNERCGSQECRNYNLGVGLTGLLAFSFVYDPSGTGGAIFSDVALNTNTWYYVAVTYDRLNIMLYINGVLVKTVAETDAMVPTSSTNFSIGRAERPTNSDYGEWNGFLDEVRIYNAALTTSEIWNLYQEGGVKLNKSQSNNGDSLNDGLAGYWKLDDASGTTATDSSGNSGNGTLTNGPTWGTGQIGGATTFDGTNDYITIPDAAILRPGNGDFTVSVWANPPNTNQLAFLVSKTAGNPGYSMRICGADPSCGGYSGKRFVFTYAESMVAPIYRGAYSTADIADGSWHLFTAVADKTANLIRLYVDGKEIAANQGTGGSWPNITNTEALILGSFTGSNYYHTGSLDEVRIYNRILSGEEISRLYKTTNPTNPESGLVGYWSFDGPTVSGTTARDSSGKGNNGTLTNGPTLTIGRVGQAVNFDGVNDNIVTPSIAMDPANGRSFSAWFKINSLAAEVNILSQNSTILNVRTDGSIRFYWTGGGFHYTSGITITTGTWYHIVGVETTTAVSNYKVYINGTKYLDEDDPWGHYGGSGALTISGAPYFPGVIDEVRAYTKSLSATEVSNLYNFGR